MASFKKYFNRLQFLPLLQQFSEICWICWSWKQQMKFKFYLNKYQFKNTESYIIFVIKK